MITNAGSTTEIPGKDTGRYGKLLSGEMERLGCYPKWSWDGWMMDEPRSGFVPFDLHIHDLDFVVYAFGAPSKVDHFRSKQKDQDFLHAVYSYPDFFVSVEASWFAAPYPFHMSFRFQFEDAVVAYEDAKLSIYQRDGKVICPFDDTDAAEFSQLPQSSGYASEIHYFYDCLIGAYTSMQSIKQKHIELENMLFTTEKLCSMAELNGLYAWNREAFEKVEKSLAMLEFHDIASGTCAQDGEKSSLRKADSALELLQQEFDKAFFSLCTQYTKAGSGEFPVSKG